MTLESSLPYLSVAAAIAAAATNGKVARGLRAAALAALGVFAYLRGITPAAVALALILGAAGQAMAPESRARWTSAGAGLLAAGWLAFAYLFLKTGGGLTILIQQPWRIGALVLLAVLIWLGWRVLWPKVIGARGGAGAEMAAVLVMTGAAFSLHPASWAWIAMAGALLAALAETALLGLDFAGWRGGAWTRRAAWIGGYAGQAAMAYAFLK